MNIPKAKKIKDNLEDMIEPYLEYMGKVAPDIAPQIAFLKKFHKFLLGIFHNLQKDKDMWCLVGMVHGDSKIDNFMFKKVCNRHPVGCEVNRSSLSKLFLLQNFMNNDLEIFCLVPAAFCRASEARTQSRA